MNFIISHYGFTTRPCPRLTEVCFHSTVLGLAWSHQTLVLRFIYNCILPDTGDVTLDRLLDTAHLCLHTIHINLGYQGRGLDFEGPQIHTTYQTVSKEQSIHVRSSKSQIVTKLNKKLKCNFVSISLNLSHAITFCSNTKVHPSICVYVHKPECMKCPFEIESHVCV